MPSSSKRPPARPAVAVPRFGRHASPLRGLGNVPRSPMFEGRFGRMFRRLPAADFDEADLKALAKAMIQPRKPDTELGVPDPEDNPAIPAGYTYLGQFIDHDLTFDPASSFERKNDPDALVDFRTPRFDLDSVYGRGPHDQPYMYESDGKRLVTGKPVSDEAAFAGPDLPRAANNRAIIGDPRNDENKIISQLQSLMIRFHNQVVATTGLPLDVAQRVARFHYQWIVLHDFLPRICGQDVVDAVLNVRPQGSDRAGRPLNVRIDPDLRFYKARNEAFVPVEFSVAAYRFGHSMVRPSYLINDIVKPPPEHKRIPIFSAGDGRTNLNGFDTLPRDWGVQWGFFFPLRDDLKFAQPSYKIDEKLADPLGSLPPSVATNPASLAERNLLRGVALGLPSGQHVADAMGFHVLPDSELFEDENLRARFKRNAPLWYYILRESSVVTQGARLGPVGARLVAETFIGLMWKDSHSMLRQSPGFRPSLPVDGGIPVRFGMPELVKFAKAPV